MVGELFRVLIQEAMAGVQQNQPPVRLRLTRSVSDRAAIDAVKLDERAVQGAQPIRHEAGLKVLHVSGR